MTDPIQPLIPLPFVCNTSRRVTCDISQTLTQFLNNLIYNSTTPLSFELYPEDVYTAPLIREHHVSYLFCFGVALKLERGISRKSSN